MPKYERPYNLEEIRRTYGDEVVERLAKDPVHLWRADTGIELLHKEPDLKEFKRIVSNWKLMDDAMKAESDKKSMELFGKGNMERVGELLEAYRRREKARRFVSAVRKMALKRKLNMFLVTDGASGVVNNGNPAVRNAREAQIRWELKHGDDPYEDWSKKAESKPMTPEELNKLYSVLKYRILHKETNRPFFNTNRKAFANWHLLSPEQIKKHKIGICWDTAAMTDSELSRLGIPHENYFSHSEDLNRPTHAFNVYRDENGDWRWIEGSWEKYKDNDWHERRKQDLVRRIVRALESEGFDEETGGDKQIVHKIDKFPAAGVNGRQFFNAMLKMPVKKAQACDRLMEMAEHVKYDVNRHDLEKNASFVNLIKHRIEFLKFLRKYDQSGSFRALLRGKDKLPRYSHEEVRKLLPVHAVFRGAAKDPVHISGRSPTVFGPDVSAKTMWDPVVKPENVTRAAHNMRHVTPNLTWAKWYINDMSKSNGLVSVYDVSKIPELTSGRVGFYEDWGAAKAMKDGTFYGNPSSARAAKNLKMTLSREQSYMPVEGRLPKPILGFRRPETLLDVTKNQPDQVFSLLNDRNKYIDMTPLLDVMRPKQTRREQALARLARMKVNRVIKSKGVGENLVTDMHRSPGYGIPVFE